MAFHSAAYEHRDSRIRGDGAPSSSIKLRAIALPSGGFSPAPIGCRLNWQRDGFSPCGPARRVTRREDGDGDVLGFGHLLDGAIATWRAFWIDSVKPFSGKPAAL
jgi:hypothetical protein